MYLNKKKPTKSRFITSTALLLSLITVGTSSPHAAFTPNRTQRINPLAPSTHLRRLAPSTSFHKLDGKIKKPSQLHSSLNLDNNNDKIQNNNGDEGIFDSIKSWVVATGSGVTYRKPPPIQIEDTSVLFYDIFLILNLTLSISFWVVHRLSFQDILPALSEGSLLCILWVIAGLWNGAFLFSAVDGHYDTNSNEPEHEGKGGPTSAALLGLSTFIGTANLRILFALGTAVLEHRKVGVANGEELIPLEIAFGLMLMSAWRMLHSSYTRI